MNERVYNRFANTLMMIGIASALLFDSGKLPKVAIGSIGILAGLSAMVLYFWNQHQIQNKGKAEEKPQAAETGETPRKLVIPRRPGRETDAIRDWVTGANAVVWADVAWKHMLSSACETDEIVRRRRANAWLRQYAGCARTLEWKVPSDAGMMLMQPEVELSPNEVAACAIEIVRNLAATDTLNNWEYDFGPKGLRVSVRKGYRPMRPVSAQEDLNFGQNAGSISKKLRGSDLLLQD